MGTLADEKAREELSQKIKELLISDARVRDNDALLINRIQRHEVVGYGNINEMNINDFFLLRIEGKVSSEYDIVCLRKEIQEKFPETRKEVHVEKTEGAPILEQEEEFCEHCQGTKVYESFPCNVCCGDKN